MSNSVISHCYSTSMFMCYALSGVLVWVEIIFETVLKHKWMEIVFVLNQHFKNENDQCGLSNSLKG